MRQGADTSCSVSYAPSIFSDSLKKPGTTAEVNKSQGLAPRHRKFALYYLQSLNATEAARKAGYNGDNLAAIGSRLLRREPVKAFLSDRLDKAMNADLIILRAKILKLWQEIMENAEQPAMVRLKAMEHLAKYCGLFEQGQTVNVVEPLIVYFPETARE